MTSNPVHTALFAGSSAEWDTFVATQPGATASHLFAWKTIVEHVYGHDCPYLVAFQAARPVGVLPLVDVRSLAFGRFLVSMPYLNGGGPLGTPAAVRALAAAACELARRRRAALLELRCASAREIELPYTGEKVESVLHLPESADELWKRLPSKLRSQIRRPMKAGIEVRFGDDQLRAFFTVFARNMRDLGSPTHSYKFFEAILEHLPSHVWFGAAYYEDKPVAAGCALHFEGDIEMTWASSLREHNAIAPNMLLYWSFIARAADQGFKRFSFGRSTPQTGTHRFKQQWGATDVPLHWYRAALMDGGRFPRHESGKLSLPERVWTHMPVALATLVGPGLRRGIPY